MKKIALITWWKNKEREISLLSGQNILENLDKTRYEVVVFDFPNEKQNFIKSYNNFDIVLPIIHWIWWEDWEITAFCEFVWKSYLFSDSSEHKLCLNKYLSGIFVSNYWVNTPKTYLVKDIYDIENIKINWKIFVKPCNWWSSVDNWVFENILEAKSFIENILTYDEVLVQEFIKKDREFTVSVAWDYDKNPKVLAISEIVTEKEIFDYNAKYKSDWAIEIANAIIDEKLKNEIKTLSLKIYKMFKLKSFSRIDLLYANWKIYFLEVNTIPWFTRVSLLPQAIIASWSSIKDFLNDLIW